MAEPDTCEAFTHCQYPSVYLAAKMVVVMENKRSLQRPLKMNEGKEQITQGFPVHSGHFMPLVGWKITPHTVKYLTIIR